jgi:hypothetical protein
VDLRKATQEEIDAALARLHPKAADPKPDQSSSDLTIMVAAHFVDSKSDKIYGVVKHNGKTYTFWGGNHKLLTIKHHLDARDAYKQYDSKIAKGYEEMSPREFAQAKGWMIAALKSRYFN